MTELERSFDHAAWHATRECKILGYHPTYTIRLMTELGTVQAARQMLERSADSDGFTRLFLLDRLDLSIENIALQSEFRDLFSRELRAEARRRLIEVNYPVLAEVE
jgi:hypothetical protein